jgi:hypothetical protein
MLGQRGSKIKEKCDYDWWKVYFEFILRIIR